MLNSESANRQVLWGIYCSIGAFFLFACQDATVKWLVAGLAVPQILFFRSLTILALISAWRGPKAWNELAQSRDLGPLVLRGVLMLGAWLFFYNAAKTLPLAELTVIYYGSPLIVTLLSGPVLKEKVPFARWLATLLGFAGVILACLPHDASQPLAMGLAGIAAVLWAISMLLMRSIAGRADASLIMLSQNLTLALGCILPLYWLWVPPSFLDMMMIIGLGVGSALGQFLIYKAAQFAPASVVAPMEYSSLIWAFILGFWIWGDIPPETVFMGGAMVIASGLVMIFAERRRRLIT
jgi:drug/metabolite transporter (DMT)-like permease